jgi:propanol-preferring alcohol dehydrogenase
VSAWESPGWPGPAASAATARAGRENLCPRASFTGFSRDGGYASSAIADARYCFPLPDGYDDVAAAPLLCAGLIGARTLRLAGEAERVGIYGFGAAGHLWRRSRGRADSACSPSPGRATPRRSASRGAGRRVGGRFRVGAAGAARRRADLRPGGRAGAGGAGGHGAGGTVVCGGIHMSDIPSFPYSLLWEERQVRSVANLTRDDARDLLATAALTPLRVETRVLPLEDANRALDELRGGKVRGALVLVAALAGALACGPAPKTVTRPVERGATVDASSERSLAERLWSERLDEAKLRGALAAWKRALALDDADVASYAMAAHASYFLADGFLALDGRKQEMKAVFEDGAALAERGLRALSPDFEKRRRAGGGVDVAAVGARARRAVPLLYFWAQNVIRWADAEGMGAAMRVYKQVFQRDRAVARARIRIRPRRRRPLLRRRPRRVPPANRRRKPGEEPRPTSPARSSSPPDYLENHLVPRHVLTRAAPATPRSTRSALRRVLDAPPDGIPEQEIAKKKARLQPATL